MKAQLFVIKRRVNTFMFWIMTAVLSAVFAGLTSILAKCGIKKTDSDLATALRTIVVLVFSWIMVFVAGSFGTITDIASVPHPLGACHGRILDLLFQGAFHRRYQQGRSH